MTDETKKNQNEDWREGILSGKKRDEEKIHFRSSWSENAFMRRATIITGLGFISLCLGLLVYYSRDNLNQDAVPIIVAEAGPHKIKIESDENLTNASQDKSIYSRLGKHQDEETTTMAATEPEAPQAKPPVFPEEFISSLDKEDDIRIAEIQTKPQTTTLAQVPAVISEASKAKQPESLPASSLSDEMEVAIQKYEASPPEQTAAVVPPEKSTTGAPESEVFSVPYNPVKPPVPEAKTIPEQAAEAVPSVETFTAMSQVAPKATVLATTHEELQKEIVDHADIPITTTKSLKDKSPKPLKMKGGYVIQVASLRQESGATEEWQRIKRQAGSLLENKSLLIQKIDLGRDRGVYYRVQVGPMNKSEAANLCLSLKNKGVNCYTHPY